MEGRRYNWRVRCNRRFHFVSSRSVSFFVRVSVYERSYVSRWRPCRFAAVDRFAVAPVLRSLSRFCFSVRESIKRRRKERKKHRQSKQEEEREGEEEEERENRDLIRRKMSRKMRDERGYRLDTRVASRYQPF